MRNPSEPQKVAPIDKDVSKKESTFIPNRLNREKKSLDQLKGEIDEQTWHELKYFEKELAAEKT